MGHRPPFSHPISSVLVFYNVMFGYHKQERDQDRFSALEDMCVNCMWSWVFSLEQVAKVFLFHLQMVCNFISYVTVREESGVLARTGVKKRVVSQREKRVPRP